MLALRFLLFCGLLSVAAGGQVFIVGLDTGNYETIGEAVGVAGPGDTIIINLGFIVELAPVNVNKELTFEAGMGISKIEGSSSSPIFIVSDTQVRLINITLTKSTDGPCLKSDNSNLTLTSVRFELCGTLGSEGGLQALGSSITCEDCVFKENRGVGMNISEGSAHLTNAMGAVNSGGSIFCDSSTMVIEKSHFEGDLQTSIVSRACTVSLADSSFTSNTGAEGGAVQLEGGSLASSNCAYTGNAALSGGGIFQNGGHLLSVGDQFFTNNASKGGAINSGAAKTVVIMNSVFYGNTADLGGSLVVSEAPANISECNFTVSEVATLGGAWYLEQATIISDNNEFRSNTARDGGAIYSLQSRLSSFGDVFVGNRAENGGALYDISGTEVTLDSVACASNTASWGGALYFKLTNKTSLVGLRVKTNTATNSGGVICCDRAVNVKIKDSVATNNRANGSGGVLYASNCNTEIEDCSFTNNFARTAGGALNAPSGTIRSSNNEFVNNTSTQGGAIMGVACTLDLTGDVFTTNLASLNGGAVALFNGKAIMNGIQTTSNVATTTNNIDFPEGGALFLSLCNVTLVSSRFSGDSAATGGGILFQACNVQMDNCVVTGSQATGQGGGIYINAKQQNQAAISRTVISSCTAPEGGGAYVQGNLSFSECSFLDNRVTQYGGGANLLDSWATFGSCVFDGNCALINGSAYWVNSGEPSFDTFIDQLQNNCTSTTSTPTTTAPTATLSTNTTTSTTLTTSTSTSTSTSTPANCTVSCPTVIIDDGSNTTWQVVENTTEVRVTVPSNGNSSVSFQIGWGSIREVTASGKLVKTIDPLLENWPRTIEQNDTAVVITYSAVETRPPWQNSPVKISLTTILFLRQTNSTTSSSSGNGKVVASAKFSLFVDGRWQFAHSLNKLEADFTVRGAFESTTKCGKEEKYHVDEGEQESVFQFGSAESSAVSLGVAEWCVVDGINRRTNTLAPAFYKNNTAVVVTIQFPSFNSSLYYDPNFGLLLGFDSESSCSPLLAWILPVSFLGGAALIILVAIAASAIPQVKFWILGSEGMRVRNLRNFIQTNQLGLDADLSEGNLAARTHNDGW